MVVDLSFVLTGTVDIPADHGYHLYASVSRLLPAVHEPNGIGIHPIRGRLIGERRMQLCDSGAIAGKSGSPPRTGGETVCRCLFNALRHQRMTLVPRFLDGH